MLWLQDFFNNYLANSKNNKEYLCNNYLLAISAYLF